MLQIIQIVSVKPHCNYRFLEQELELQVLKLKFEGVFLFSLASVAQKACKLTHGKSNLTHWVIIYSKYENYCTSILF